MLLSDISVFGVAACHPSVIESVSQSFILKIPTQNFFSEVSFQTSDRNIECVKISLKCYERNYIIIIRGAFGGWCIVSSSLASSQ